MHKDKSCLFLWLIVRGFPVQISIKVTAQTHPVQTEVVRFPLCDLGVLVREGALIVLSVVPTSLIHDALLNQNAVNVARGDLFFFFKGKIKLCACYGPVVALA